MSMETVNTSIPNYTPLPPSRPSTFGPIISGSMDYIPPPPEIADFAYQMPPPPSYVESRKAKEQRRQPFQNMCNKRKAKETAMDATKKNKPSIDPQVENTILADGFDDFLVNF